MTQNFSSLRVLFSLSRTISHVRLRASIFNAYVLKGISYNYYYNIIRLDEMFVH